MPDTIIESALRRTNDELSNKISLLEVKLRERRNQHALAEASGFQYRRLFETAKDGILILDAHNGRVVDVNPFLMELLGYSYDEMVGKYIWELGAFKDIAASKEAFKTLQENEYIRYDDLPLESRKGRPIYVEFVSNVYQVRSNKVIQCNIRDITERKQNEAVRETERRKLLAAIGQAGDAIVMTDANENIEFVNPAFERTSGYGRDEIIGLNLRVLRPDPHDESFYRDLWNTVHGGQTWTGRLKNKRKDGSLRTVEMTMSPVRDDSDQIVNYVAVKRDITEQLELAAQFQQSQKMEAVGLLAGGVAHDYNNMLTVIVGYTELGLCKVDPSNSIHDDLVEILKAANRSADITRQLLAFARKQTIIPIPLDLNRSVESMMKMLHRLIGEDIDLIWRAGNVPCCVRMDPVQIDQVLANLCVNARDAIGGVGKVIIETGKASFDENWCTHNPGYMVGEFVLLSVTDDGCGMTREILSQIFEPFFTNKEVGQGTGLGLSTVYGIVKQNDGFLKVDSEPGEGAAFRIYLPKHDGVDADAHRMKLERLTPCNPVTTQVECILLVEDEPSLLILVKRMLENLGFRVLEAGSPRIAIELARKHAGEINLLLTDAVMPAMNGRDLADQVLSICPDMKIVFMSGYTANIIINRGILDEGVNYLQKPFTMNTLAAKLRDALRVDVPGEKSSAHAS